MIAAELYFAIFIPEHNLPFLASDHFTKPCEVMFPDSDIAKRYSSGRTKSTALGKHTVAPALSDQVVKFLRHVKILLFQFCVMGGTTKLIEIFLQCLYVTGNSHEGKLSLVSCTTSM